MRYGLYSSLVMRLFMGRSPACCLKSCTTASAFSVVRVSTWTGWVSKQNSVDHLLAKDIYGIFGAKSFNYLLIDLDYHNNSLTLVLRRLSLLLDLFHRRNACRIQLQQ